MESGEGAIFQGSDFSTTNIKRLTSTKRVFIFTKAIKRLRQTYNQKKRKYGMLEPIPPSACYHCGREIGLYETVVSMRSKKAKIYHLTCAEKVGLL